MDVTEKIFLVEKHRFKWGKKHKKVRARRAFEDATAEGVEKLTRLAEKYAAMRDEDFLIVKVVAEVTRPAKDLTTKDTKEHEENEQ